MQGRRPTGRMRGKEEGRKYSSDDRGLGTSQRLGGAAMVGGADCLQTGRMGSNTSEETAAEISVLTCD